MKLIKFFVIFILIAVTFGRRTSHTRRDKTSNGPTWQIKKIEGLGDQMFISYRSGQTLASGMQMKVLSLGEIEINGKSDTKSLCFEFPKDLMNKDTVKSYTFLNLIKESSTATEDKYFCYDQTLYDIDYKCKSDHSKDNMRLNLHFKARNAAQTDLKLEVGYSRTDYNYPRNFFKNIQLRVQDYSNRDVDCYPSTKPKI